MASERTTLRALQAVGLTTSAAVAGYSMALSTAVIPRILESPTPLLLKQWLRTFNAGKIALPPFAVFCSSIFGFLAYSSHKLEAHRHVTRGYVVGAVMPLLIVPYTVAFIAPTNTKLIAKEEETRSLALTDKVVEVGLGDETAHALVDKWGLLNLGRTVLLAVGAFAGTFTALVHEL